MEIFSEGRTLRILTIVAIAMGGLCIVVSALLLGLSGLGRLGALADVGPVENRNMGVQLLSMGLPPLVVGVALCALGFLAFVWNRRRASPRPGAAVLK